LVLFETPAGFALFKVLDEGGWMLCRLPASIRPSSRVLSMCSCGFYWLTA
jgi:hypothetical protein